MDAAKNVADELNRGRYNENVLKYFFDKPDAYEQAFTDSEDDLMYNIRLDSLAAEKEWQDMRIIGHLEANRRTVQTSEMVTSTKKTPTKRKCARTTYFIGGNEICKNTFLFLMG